MFNFVEFEVLRVVVMENSALRVGTPYSPLKVIHYFGEHVAFVILFAACFIIVSCLAYSSTLKIKSLDVFLKWLT
jgi:hypothetical protein